MSKLLKILKEKGKSVQSFKKCPNGGYCFNPLCALGCVDSV
jgi:hypothetical protein